MKQGNKETIKQGFSLVEVILASALFALMVTVLVGAFIYGQEATAIAGQRTRAAFLAEEGLEAVRNIRDEDFSNLTDGVHGLVISGNQWLFSGSRDTTDIFTRQIEISTLDPNRKQITANVSWQESRQRTGLVSKVTYLTNWMRSAPPPGSDASNLVVNTADAAIDSLDNTRVIGITLQNIGLGDITIDRMTIVWTGGLRLNRVNEIIIDGVLVWLGKANSGDGLDISNFTLTAFAGSYPIDYIDFSRDMTGTTLEIAFTMTDGSTKIVSGITP